MCVCVCVCVGGGGGGGVRVKSDQLSRLFTYGVPIPLNTFYSFKSKNKGDIRHKYKIGKFNSNLNFYYKYLPFPNSSYLLEPSNPMANTEMRI